MMCDYAFFSKDPSQLDEAYQLLWGHHDICPILEQFHIALVTQLEVSSITCLLQWGDPKRFHSDVAFLLILPEKAIDNVARKLILLASPGPNWPCAFVWFNGDAYHMPLPKEGHLSAMTKGTPSNILCRRICQLEVHQLFHSKAQVVYPKGLNGCLVLVITSLPKSLSHSMTMLNDEPTLLQVDLLQFTMEGCQLKAPFLSGSSTSTSPTCLVMAPSPKAESQVSMTMEVSKLLSWVALHTSGQASGSSTPKRPVFPALGAPPSLRLDGFAKPVDTSSQAFLQVSIPDDAEPDDPTLEEISLPVKTLGLGANILPGDVFQLQEEVGKALGWLLATRSSLNACLRKQISDFEMALHQNESETTKVIKEARTFCVHTIREAEAHWAKLISKAEAWHTACIKEAKANCASTIAEAKNCCSVAIRRQSPMGPNRPTPFNSHMLRACSILRWRP